MKIDQVLGDGVSSWREIEGYARLVADRLEAVACDSPGDGLFTDRQTEIGN